ncbi:hypothetical protein PP737_003251 [Serratia marcescens]
MSSDNESLKIMQDALRAMRANIDALRAHSASSTVDNADQSSTSEDEAEAEARAKKEEKAFDEPSDDEHEELQDLAYWSLEHRRKVDTLHIQRTQEEIIRITCENDELRSKTRHNRAMARGRKIDNRLRLQMADATFKFMQLWCCFVALIVFIYVAKNEGNPAKEVIIALLGTSTISIVGLVGFVVSGLFKSNNKDKE